VVALETALILARKGYDRICESSVRKGLADAKWPGRLEILKKEPIFLIDGAHNAEGAKKCAETLAQNLENYCKNVSISDTIVNAVEKSLKIAPKDGVICAFGSLYYIGEIRSVLMNHK